MLIDLFARHFIFISRFVFVLFFMGYIGFSLINPLYAKYLNLTVQLIVSIFIMYNFISTNRKPFMVTPYYADVIFFAGAILFINLLSNGITFIYNDLRVTLGLTFLPEQPPIIESRFPDFPKA